MPTSAAEGQTATRPTLQFPSSTIDMRWLGGDQRLLLRPVLPQDHHLLADLLQSQSAKARRNRFHAAINPSPRLCRQMSQVDYPQQLALVVCRLAPRSAERLVAEARYSVNDDGCSADFALMVDEAWQGLGVGRWALQALQQAAARAGLRWLEGEVLQDNHRMLDLARGCGFACRPDPHDGQLVRLHRRLAPWPAAGAINTGSAVFTPAGHSFVTQPA